jgi:hypothetical protein
MKITSENVSIGLERIDRFMDRCGLSCINNLVNCVTKACMGIYQFFYGDEIGEKGKEIVLKRYWTYVDNKDALTCALGLIPVLGSVLIWAKGQWKNDLLPCKTPAQPPSNLVALEPFENSPSNSDTQEGGEIIIQF